MDNTQIQSILQLLGERVPPLSRLYLVGGGAMVLLGSPRLTIDIDFVGDDISPSELHKTIFADCERIENLHRACCHRAFHSFA